MIPARSAILERALPAEVRDLCDALAARGHDAWVVGGSVRDALMGRAPSDWDVATTAPPEEVRRTFRRTIPTGIAHGTVSVMLGARRYEVTTLRGEAGYADGRHPDAVTFGATIEEDLGRRDFTVNAIAFHPRTGALVDPWRGLDDLAARTVRAVRDPMERFAEDGLRVLRAARFVASLEFELDPTTEAAIRPNLATYARVSSERVHDEWLKTFASREPSRAFRIMARTGMLEVSAPLLASLDGVAITRALARVDRAPRAVAPARLAALLWEVRASEGAIDAWLRALRFSNRERAETLLVLAHRDAVTRAWEAPSARRFVRGVGAESLAWVLETLEAAAEGADQRERVERLRGLAEAVVRARDPIDLKALAITGADVMRLSGRGPGRYVGLVLERLLEEVLEDPSRNDPGSLAERARAIAEEVAT